jgi:hypothetical protein
MRTRAWQTADTMRAAYRTWSGPGCVATWLCRSWPSQELHLSKRPRVDDSDHARVVGPRRQPCLAQGAASHDRRGMRCAS